jgi:hypothetical protein
MAITVPYTARYFIRFRHSDTGLTPTFTYFKRSDTLVAVTAPAVSEVGGGSYYFDYTFTTLDSPDIIFELDGGASIPTEEVRYVSDTISLKDNFIDQPTSQVSGDVWQNGSTYLPGQKGWFIDAIGAPSVGASLAAGLQGVYDRLGVPLDTNLAADVANVFGIVVEVRSLQGNPTDTSAALTEFGKLAAAISNLKGIDNRDNSQVMTRVALAETNLDAAIDAVSTTTGNIPSDLTARLDYLHDSTERLLGLTKENSVLGNTFFDSQGNLIQGDLTIYPSATDVSAGTNALATYRITAQWDGQKVQNYTMVKQP